MSNMVLPRGAVGELCFGGYQVFKGYLNQPDLTAEKIISHSTYGRIYRSGDLGLLLADDSILFTGRMDDQVKIRGQRVELGEISFAVLDQECVRDCTTLLLKLAPDSKKLVNFWVPAMAADPMFSTLNIKEFHSDTRTIFSSLSHRLPPYMVPSHLVPITQLPMTPQGKIDKRLLQRCFEHLTDGDLEYATQSYDSDTHTRMAIITPWELQTASILAGTLGLSKDSITRNTSFFSLGLDSVSAISFSNELRKAHVGDFSISTILKNSTVAQLAVAKEGLTSSEQKPTGSAIRVDKAIVPAEVSRIHDLFVERGMTPSKIMPCTPLQEAMLSSAHSACESLYSNVMVFTINGELSHLQECWATMFQRHEILRTSFIATDDPSHAFAQVVLNDTSIQWGSMDWSSTLYQYANEMVSTLLYESKPPVWLAIAKAEDSTKLLFCCHHAVYDGIAIQTLLKELQQIYYHHKIPPSIPFEVYLQHMLSQDFSEADQFWTKFFKDFEPTSFPDLTGQSHKRAHISASKHQRLRLPLSQVRGACQSASVSLLSVIQASWAKLLHFYTGESDVCFGNVVSGRAFIEHDLEQLVAPCFNTVPARIKFDFHNENLALAHQAHAFNVDSSAFQLTPLRRIQNLALKDGGRLFDTLVILQQPSEPLDNTIWTLEEDRGDMDLPLVCEVSQSVAEDHLDLVLHYHHTILSEKEASIVAKTFDTILATIINRPHAPANDTIDLPPYLRAEYSSTFDALESNSNLLHSGFEQIVQTHPKRTALDFLYADGTRTTWSFQTLNYRANDIAHVLIDKGVKPDDIIPLHIAKSPLFYASVLGVLKAGAAFAPVHPDLPEERKRLMLENLKADLVLCTKENEVLGLVDNVSLLDVETLEHLSRDNPVINNLTESSLAYCLFTSGSTGVPKAVSMEHHAPVRTIGSSKSLVPWSDSSRLLQYAAITFDMCYYDCFLAWTFGFALCAAEQNLMLDELPGIINTLGVDLLDLTPSVANSLIRQEVPGVKWLYCIGEAMSPNIVEEWEGACVNSYGPTEAAFCTTMFPISKHIKTSVIGKPFPSTSFAVFSGGGDRPLPLLSTGELYIGGAQLARGYFGKPELTEEKFVTRCGQRYYRSGDIVRMLSDGNFEFIGRADDQVKIRGLRVELGEINVVLESSHPDIATATTHIQKKDAAAKEQLVAFLVPVETIGDEKRQDIRRHLRQVARNRLPSYMVPQFFLFIDRLPRSLAGKVDKKALADIFRHSSDIEVHSDDTSTKAAEHNWTTLERHIRDVFVRLSSSSLEDIFPRTTIYQLGLDSISAVQIATALRRQGHIVSAADVMQQLTCVDLAACIERKAKTQQAPTPQFDFEKFNATHRPYVVTYYNIVDKDVATIYPCTPLQTGMISQMLAKDGASYVNYIRLRLESNVDLDALKQAWAKTMLTHQILRTGFAHLHSKTHPFGMIEYTSDAVTLPWEIFLDKDTLEDSELWLAKLQRKVKAELDRPPWKIRVVIDTGTTYLDIAIFHALFDAQSLQTIFQDVIAAYKGHDLKTRPNVDSVIDGILERSSDNNEERKKFWVQMGEQNSPYRFPNLAPLRYEPEKPVICTSRSYKSLPDIEEACRQANTTVQAVGLAGWLSLISAYTGEPTAACGVVLSGRTFEAAEDAVFPCINTVPFAQNVSADSNKMLGAVTAVIAEVQQHQYTPLKDIQRLMGHPNEAVFDTIFAYQKLPTSRDTKDIWSVVEERATIEYPISIELEPRGNHLEFRLTTMPHTIPREQAVLMLEQLDHLMQCFIFPKEDSKIFDTSLYSVTPAMEPTLPSSARLLHDFVEFTALEHPQRIALEFARSIEKDRYSSQHWTYSEIDEEGNKVAHLLISSGMQPGNLVGVCFDKCPEASFAMLGILKAGCAFVAIDPGAPAARQCFVVQDSGAKAVLSMATQSKSFIDGVRVPVLNLDETDVSSLLTTKPVLEREISQQDRSYCLYTSGTTGTPKGCELTHENAVQALLAFQGLFAGHWNSESRWLQFASFHFDVSVLEQYWSWSVGICVVSAPRDVIFEDLANSISTLGITHIDLTPSLAQILHPDDVPSLCRGVFITGGESLKQEILDVWGPKGVIYNGYGPTEATIGCTMYPRVPTNGKPSNIGRQFDNVGTFVLQPSTDIPVLRGGIGELCVSGKLVGKGYLNRDDLTKRSFPYLERYKERVYRTGDLVRILHNGTFEFLGRADDQVKLRGQRLEIGEINSVIRQSGKTISDVATLVLKHPRQQKAQLVAFVVQSRANGSSEVLLGDASETSRAREVCQEKLPPYMVPTHFIPITFLPLNINNKADSKKLREIYESISTTDLQKLSINSDANDQSLSMQEAELRTVIKDELDTSEETVGKDTSFFELGMDSISVIGVARALKQSGFPSAKASLIMTHSTIRRLAKALSAGVHTNDHASLLAAQQAISAMRHRHRAPVARAMSVELSEIEALAPCTPLQEGMIARYLDGEEGLYFNTFVFELSDRVDYDNLQKSWQTVYAATQILRTVYTETEDGYVQAVLRNPNLPWHVEHATKGEAMSNCLEKLRKNWLQRNGNAFIRPFELIFLTSPGQQLLVVHIFHGLYDGLSIELIFDAVWDVYNGHELNSNNAPSFHEALPHGPLRTIEGAKSFWLEHLSSNATGSPPLLTYESTSTFVKITRQLHTPVAFESTRRKLNVTAQAIAQACWLGALQEQLKTTTTVGLVVSGRSIDLEGAERITGPMFNTIPYRHRPQRSESWTSIMKRVHEFNVAVHPYQHTPLRDIAKWCKTNHSQPLFDSLFVYQKMQDEKQWKNNEVWKIVDGDATVDYPLAFEIEQRTNESWGLTLMTQDHMLDRLMPNKLLDRFEVMLHQATSDSSATFETIVEVKDVAENGEMRVATNGVDSKTAYNWTDNALILRETLADLTRTGLDEVDESTSIFELGLDSIDAIKVSAKLKRRGIHLSVSGIMRGLTIAKMLPHVSSSDITQQDDVPIDTDFIQRKHELEDYINRQNDKTCQIEDILPLTPLQEAMIAEMITSEFTKYYNFDVMKLGQNTNIDTLRNAWTQVVEASPILRTSFVEIDDPNIDSSYAQLVHIQPHDFWTQMTLANEPDFSALFRRLRVEAIQASSAEPPFRIVLVEASGQVYLVLCISHALYDGWSLGLLHSDVGRAYLGQLESRPSYQDTLASILSTAGTDAATFWGDYLLEAKPSTFIRRLSTTKNVPQAVHRLEKRSELIMKKITHFAKKSNVSLQTLGQSVFAIVVASYVRSLDVSFGSVLSGRDDETIPHLLFPTMNTVAIRIILHGTRIELLRHVQDSFSNVKQWQHFPLRKALGLAGARGGLFESLFIYQKSVSSSKNDDQKLYTSIEGYSDVEYPVCVEMEVIDGKLVWRCAVKDEVFDSAGAEELLARLDRVLSEILQRPDQPVINFSSQGISVCELPPFKNENAEDVACSNTDLMKGQNEESEHQRRTVRTIRQVLAAVSGIAEDNITDDMTIFHIGLDSISAIKVSSLLRRKDIVLSVGEMLKAGTVHGMARIVDLRVTQSSNGVEDHSSTIESVLLDLDHVDIIRRANDEGLDIDDISEAQMLPATAGQLYMISMWLRTNGSNFYPEFTYRLSGDLPFETLQNAWRMLLAANPILRTYLLATQDKQIPYVQLIHRSGKQHETIIDVTGRTEEEVNQIVSLNKISQPWARLYIAQSKIGWDLRLKIHHALYDGVSLPILIRQFQGLCNGDTQAPPNDVLAKFVASSVGPSVLKSRRSFWQEYLDGVRQSLVTQSRSSVAKKTEIFTRSLISTKVLEGTARRNGVSIHALFLAVYAELYAALTRSPRTQDVVIGVYLANRSLSITDIESAAVPTVNLVPLRVCRSIQNVLTATARQIQVDLQRIGESAHASASLWEIAEHTAVKIDTFVNFLTLPDAQGKEEGQGKEGVQIAQTSQWEEDVNHVVDSSSKLQPEDQQHAERLSCAEVNGSYLVSVRVS
jgi:amino acid adenylation domain-containing protein